MLNELKYALNVTNLFQNDTADSLVIKNNEIINQNKDYWDLKGRKLSEHLIRLEKSDKKLIDSGLKQIIKKLNNNLTKFKT